jgi:hypothetical protein
LVGSGNEERHCIRSLIKTPHSDFEGTAARRSFRLQRSGNVRVSAQGLFHRNNSLQCCKSLGQLHSRTWPAGRGRPTSIIFASPVAFSSAQSFRFMTVAPGRPYWTEPATMPIARGPCSRVRGMTRCDSWSSPTLHFVQAYRPTELQMRLSRLRKRHSTVRLPATATASARSRMSALLKPNFCKLETRRPIRTAWLYLQPPRWGWPPVLSAAVQDRDARRQLSAPF